MNKSATTILFIPNCDQPEWLKVPGVNEAIENMWKEVVKEIKMNQPLLCHSCVPVCCKNLKENELMEVLFSTIHHNWLKSVKKTHHVPSASAIEQNITIINVPWEKPIWFQQECVINQFENLWKKIVIEKVDFLTVWSIWNNIPLIIRRWLQQIVTSNINSFETEDDSVYDSEYDSEYGSETEESSEDDDGSEDDMVSASSEESDYQESDEYEESSDDHQDSSDEYQQEPSDDDHQETTKDEEQEIGFLSDKMIISPKFPEYVHNADNLKIKETDDEADSEGFVSITGNKLNVTVRAKCANKHLHMAALEIMMPMDFTYPDLYKIIKDYEETDLKSQGCFFCKTAIHFESYKICKYTYIPPFVKALQVTIGQYYGLTFNSNKDFDKFIGSKIATGLGKCWHKGLCTKSWPW